jgi:hypothetical protein
MVCEISNGIKDVGFEQHFRLELFGQKHSRAFFEGEIVPQGKLVPKATLFLPRGKVNLILLKNIN